MKLIVDIPKSDLLFVNVPDTSKKYKIIKYVHAGTYLVDVSSKEFNSWKMKLPGKDRDYEVIGSIKDSVFSVESLNEIETDKNFILRYI
jgi:hypothetical protein